MSSAKPSRFKLGLIALAWCVCAALRATPFTAIDDRPNLPEGEDKQAIIAGLKQQAVADWLRGYLGNRYIQFEAQITREFAERNVLSYRVSRAPGNRLQIDGELDADALKKWVRLSESKGRDSSLRPALAVKSRLPGLTLDASETASRAKDSALVQNLLSLLNTQFQKLSVAVGLPKSTLPSDNKPRSDSEIRSLATHSSLQGFNALIWIQIQPCKECGGARADAMVYSLAQGRTAVVESVDLSLDASDFAQNEKVRAALRPLAEELQNSVEKAISEGRLFSNAYQLVIENVPSSADPRIYRTPKQISSELEKLEIIRQTLLKQAEPRRLVFEILSTASVQELFQTLEDARFPGFRLKPERVDSQTLTVRYSR